MQYAKHVYGTSTHFIILHVRFSNQYFQPMDIQLNRLFISVFLLSHAVLYP